MSLPPQWFEKYGFIAMAYSVKVNFSNSDDGKSQKEAPLLPVKPMQPPACL